MALREPNFDRFSNGLPDPQEEKVLGTCQHCFGEIHSSDEVYLLGGGSLMIHTDCIEGPYTAKEAWEMNIPF